MVTNFNKIQTCKGSLPLKRTFSSNRFQKKILQFNKSTHRKRKHRPVAKKSFEKYFIWKNFKNINSIRRYKTQQRRRSPRFSFYRPLYIKTKFNGLLKRNKLFRPQINTSILRRLRTRIYYHKSQPRFNQRFHWRNKIFIQKKHKKPHLALFSWYYNHMYPSQQLLLTPQYTFRKQLFKLSKNNNASLIKRPVFDLKTKIIPSLLPSAKLKFKQKRELLNSILWLNVHQNFYKNVSKWTDALKLYHLYFLILFKKWKVSRFENKILWLKSRKSRILPQLRRNSLAQSRRTKNTKSYAGKLFFLHKLFQDPRVAKSKVKARSSKLHSESSKQLYKELTIGLTNQHRLPYNILSNILNFKRIYKQQYKTSVIEYTQYILENKYREFTSKSPEKFLRGPRIQRLKYPWLPQMISKKRAYSLQYFNFYRSLRTPWARKSNKVYRTFMWATKHKHEKVKLKLGTRGGNRSVYFKLNLLKVILPFYGKLTHRQLNKIWRTYIYVKSHYQGRAERFHTKLNATLCLLTQQLGWAPNTYWAQNSIKNGWVSVSKKNDTMRQTRFTQQLFPLLDNFKTKMKESYQINAVRNPFYQVKLNEVVQIHPYVKTFCKQFFLRRLNWNRRHLPNFAETDSRGVNAIIVNPALYYNASTKDRNKKNFLRYILN